MSTSIKRQPVPPHKGNHPAMSSRYVSRHSALGVTAWYTTSDRRDYSRCVLATGDTNRMYFIPIWKAFRTPPRQFIHGAQLIMISWACLIRLCQSPPPRFPRLVPLQQGTQRCLGEEAQPNAASLFSFCCLVLCCCVEGRPCGTACV